MPRTLEALIDGQKECVVLLPGESGWIHHPLMQILLKEYRSRNRSAVSMEYPFQTNSTPAPENNLDIEIASLKEVVEGLKVRGYEKFTYVCKSLGGLVATWLMREESYHASCVEIIIFGCVMDRGEEKGIDEEAASDKISLIVQGELDMFGNAESVKRLLSSVGSSADVVEIADGDHSYRHHGSRDLPTHEYEAVEVLFSERKTTS